MNSHAYMTKIVRHGIQPHQQTLICMVSMHLEIRDNNSIFSEKLQSVSLEPFHTIYFLTGTILRHFLSEQGAKHSLAQMFPRTSFYSNIPCSPIYLFIENMIFSLKKYVISYVFRVLECFTSRTYMYMNYTFNSLIYKTDYRIYRVSHVTSCKHVTLPTHSKVCKYISARNYIFLIYAACVYHWLKIAYTS